MLSRLTTLLCLASLGPVAAAAEKKAGFQKIPSFHKSQDCSGAVDSDSMTWEMQATHGGTVRPFAKADSYLPMWAMYKCLTGQGLTYSVKLVVDRSACALGAAEDQLQLLYYANDKFCATAPVVTPLTTDTCVTYPLGSVNVTREISLDDLCTATDYVTRLENGAVQVNNYNNGDCGGEPYWSPTRRNEKRCAEEPDCQGCCPYYNYQTCTPDGQYVFDKKACTKNGNTWRFGIRSGMHDSANCTKEMGRLFENDECVVYKVDGVTVSTRMTLLGELTVEAVCKLNEMFLRNNIDASVVAWDELNSVGRAVPQLLVLAALLVAVLL